MSKKLPKHVAQLVEKNNLVAAIKELAAEESISMGEAKMQIDAYEENLKKRQEKKVQAIAKKQGVIVDDEQPKNVQILTQSLKELKELKDTPSTSNNLNEGLDRHLASIGYKKPLVPYWAKRVFIILTVMVLLGLLFQQLF